MKRSLTLLLLGKSLFLDAAPVVFEYEDELAQEVAVAGEFNGWTLIPMSRVAAGAWRASLDLPDGEYGYKFIVDGDWIMDPSAAGTRIVDGVPNSRLVVPQNRKVDRGPRTWTDRTTERTIVATLEAIEGESAVLRMNGERYEVAKERLSAPDLFYIDRWQATEPPSVQFDEATTSATPAMGAFDPTLAPFQKHVFEMPMRHKMRYWGTPGSFNPSRTPETMRVAIALPENFDPANPNNKLMVISCTADADASSVNHMGIYDETATRKGWICLAVDIAGDLDRRKEWNFTNLRHTLLHNALQDMHEVWPASLDWKYATGGFSGGSGYSIYLGIQLAEENYNLVGMWLGGSNYTDEKFTQSNKPKRAFYRAKLYSSLGQDDEIVPRNMRERTVNWGESEFRDFRHRIFDGGHSVYLPHFEEALDWFAEE